jgi:hypothetical protein
MLEPGRFVDKKNYSQINDLEFVFHRFLVEVVLELNDLAKN